MHGPLDQLCRFPDSCFDHLRGGVMIVFLDDFLQIGDNAEQLFEAILPEVVLLLRNLIQVLPSLGQLCLDLLQFLVRLLVSLLLIV